MKTILYNSLTGQTFGKIYENGYTVDGKPQPVDPPIYELACIETPAPVITTDQVSSSVWVADTTLKTYTLVWTVRDKTDEEKTAEVNAQANMKETTLNASEVNSALRLTIDTLPEEDQVNYVSTYPAWKVGIAVVVNEKYQYKDLLYKVVQSHTTQLDWPPDLVPALFVRVAAPEEIPVWVQPTGAHDAYNIGDKVHFPTISDPVYESVINANVWSPTAYPAGWKKL